MSSDPKPAAAATTTATATTRRKSPTVPGYSKPTESSAARLTSKVVRKASAATKPLLPLSEGKLYQDRAESRGQPREPETDKWHLNLENTTPARDGRQFTVANVGNNGRIYLRYDTLLDVIPNRGAHVIFSKQVRLTSFFPTAADHQYAARTKPANPRLR